MVKPDEGKGGGADRRAAREARLADKLRQNLVRRKAKARAARDDAEGEIAPKSAEVSGRQRDAATSGAKERES